MKELVFKPENVCSREMHVTYDENSGVILDAYAIGGCQGNLRGVCALIKGRKIEDVISAIKGIKCRGSRNGETSCPDQLAKGLEQIIK